MWSDLLDLDVHISGTFPYFNNVCLLPVYSKFDIVLYFRFKHLWGQTLKFWIHFILYIYFAHFSMCVWRMLTLDRERVHHFSTAGLAGMMNQVVYVWKLQFGPSHVASSTHPMLGWVTPLYNLIFTTKGFTSYSSFFIPATLCFVKSHFIV